MAVSASFSSPLRSHTTTATYPSIRSPLLPNAAAVVLANLSSSREEEGTKCVVISHREPQKWRTSVSFFSSLTSKDKGKGREALKYELLKAIEPLDRGADASPEDQERIDQIACELEAVNQVKEPLKSNLLNGRWELLYTTSGSLLGTQRPKFLRPNGNIYQAINADTLRAQNMETWPFFNQIPIKSPGRGRGELEITYLDDEIRVSRGDKGNLFILKMVDPSYRVPLS